jgi:type II secretory pathway component PulF
MQDFFTNVSRYPRYLISFSLGVLYNLISPLLPLFKRPSTAIATSLLIASGLAFIAFTLRAMLGFSAV